MPMESAIASLKEIIRVLRDRGLGRYLHHVAVDTVDGYQVACDMMVAEPYSYWWRQT